MMLHIRVSKQSRRHVGGTKDYHIVTLLNKDNERGLLITRWAKKAQWGNGIKVVRTAGQITLRSEHLKIEREKFRPDAYSSELHHVVEDYFTLDDLKKTLGQYWPKLGNHLEYLIPGIGYGHAEPEPEKVWDEKEKRWVKTRSVTAETEFVDREAEEQEKREAKKRMEDNPAWGSW